MWYIDEEGNAYLITELQEIVIEANCDANYACNKDVVYDITAHFKELDNLILATLPTKEECFKFRDEFLISYIGEKIICRFTPIVEGMK